VFRFCAVPIAGLILPADLAAHGSADRGRQYLIDELLTFRVSALDKPFEADDERCNRMMVPSVYELSGMEIAQFANFYSRQSCKP
jgi:hypothetical protein